MKIFTTFFLGVLSILLGIVGFLSLFGESENLFLLIISKPIGIFILWIALLLYEYTKKEITKLINNQNLTQNGSKDKIQHRRQCIRN